MRDRKDHLLPQVYLKEFCNPSRYGLDKPLWVFDVRGGKWNPKSPSAIAWQKGFYDYSIGAEAELGISNAESCFQPLEDSYGLVMKELKHTSYRSWKDHLPYLLKFGQMLRSRSALFIAQQMEQTRTSVLGVVSSVSPDGRTIGFRDATTDEVSPVKLRDHALTAMRREIEEGIGWMADFDWQLGLAPGVLDPFIVSENPVAMTGASRDAAQNFRHPNCEIQIPLSWKACLFGSRTRDLSIDKVLLLKSWQMHYFRAQCRAYAGQFIVSPTNLV